MVLVPYRANMEDLATGSQLQIYRGKHFHKHTHTLTHTPC